MKITLIHGQNHAGSSCTIGRMLADLLAEKQDQTEFFLPRDLNHFCTGCCACLSGDENCPFYGEKKKILDAMEGADLLIFTTPTYCMRVSGPMKSFLDLTMTNWIPHRPRASMFRKRAVVISTAAGAGVGTALKDVKTALRFWGVPEIHGYGKAVQAMSWDQVAETKKQKIRRDMEKLARKLSRDRAPSAGLFTRCLFLFAGRMMHKQGMGATDYETEYWKNQGWLERERPWKN